MYPRPFFTKTGVRESRPVSDCFQICCRFTSKSERPLSEPLLTKPLEAAKRRFVPIAAI